MSQKSVEIYTWRTCPYCQRAKALLDSKGIVYKEYQIDGDEKAKEIMSTRAHGRRTVPQIFVDENHHIGGCDDLMKLEASGKLAETFGI